MPDETRSKVETVRAMFASYLRQDRELAERLLADGFVFTSPQDDHIDRAAFFERCFPTANRLVRQDLLHVAPTGDGTTYSSCTNTSSRPVSATAMSNCSPSMAIKSPRRRSSSAAAIPERHS